jgi:hypothetical protein
MFPAVDERELFSDDRMTTLVGTGTVTGPELYTRQTPESSSNHLIASAKHNTGG